MAEKHKYFKYLADGVRPAKGLPTPSMVAAIDKLAKVDTSLKWLAQPSGAWKPSYLASKPKFWSGVGDAFNVYGYFKPKYRFRSPYLADRQALFEDWAAVSADLQRAAQDIQQLKRAAGQARLFDPAKLDRGA